MLLRVNICFLIDNHKKMSYGTALVLFVFPSQGAGYPPAPERLIMQVKSSALISGLKIEMRKVFVAADRIWLKHNQELVITSGMDGTHSPGSLHYYGYAVDLRTRYFDEDEKNTIASELRAKLGDKYDVVVHSTHIHCEFGAILR